MTESAQPVRSRQKISGIGDARSEPIPSRNGLAAFLFLLILCSSGLPVRRTAAQDGRQPATASSLDAATATRRIPLYYTRDVQKIIAAARESSSALEQVQITVVGEGLVHLCGPLAGVNAITRIIQEIDQPVGQVKIGIHVAQFSGRTTPDWEVYPGCSSDIWRTRGR